MKKFLFPVFLMIVLLFAACGSDSNDTSTPPPAETPGTGTPPPEPPPPPPPPPPDLVISSYTISSPYETVNWSTWGQFVAGHHTHTTSSDGSASLLSMVDRYYELGYDVLAITDHNYLGLALTQYWTSSPRANGDQPLTAQRNTEVQTGVGRDPARPMLEIPFSTEIAIYPDEMNTYWFPNAKSTQYQAGTPYVPGQGGFYAVLNDMKNYPGAIAQVNHPGRATGASAAAPQGLVQANNPTNINKYADLFRNNSHLVGMEIINREDGDSRHDRVFWDNLLKVIIPEGERNIWGFSNDDAHSTSAAGKSWNVMLMPSNTEANIRTSMIDGTFYAVAKVSKRELGASFSGTGSGTAAGITNAPKITNIVIADNDSLEASITITVQNAEKIQWISDGVILSEGAPAEVGTFTLNDYEDLGCYVRVNVSGATGIAFTQPIIIIKEYEADE